MRLPLLAIGLFVGASCSHKQVTLIKTPAPPVLDENSYLDLVAGSRLRILVPLLQPGKHHLGLGPTESTGHKVAVSAANLVGYETSYYSVEGQSNGKVHLSFLSSQITKDGQTVPDVSPPQLPFPLPNKTQFMRLIFLVRVSGSDHNMAIVAADSKTMLESLTTAIKQAPAICRITDATFCVWVPEGIAVRPQPPSEF